MAFAIQNAGGFQVGMPRKTLPCASWGISYLIGKDAKGYRREAFEEVWWAYVPIGDTDRTVDGNARVNGSKSTKNPAKLRVSTVQRFENRGR